MQFLSVGGWLRGMWADLCSGIYQLVAWLYELFLNVSRVELLSTKNIEPIYQRITMILTIIMVFYVTFEVVKYVVQPDSFSDKEKGGGKLTLKMILVVILIAFVPSFFTLAYKFQNVIFDNQIFSKVILGKQGIDTNKFGRVFSSNILSMFYYVDEEAWGEEATEKLEEEDNCEGIPCKTIVNANLSSLIEYGTLPFLEIGIASGDTDPEEGTGDVFKYYIHFDGLFAVAVGLFVSYMLIIYCVDIGARVVQLTFLQIIAPIPIIGYLSPKKDGIFHKWVKQCITTYLDLFIRTAIIYFGLLICQILSEAYSSGTLFNNISGELSGTMKVFIYIALILGVLMFMKKAPKLLGELFPSTGAASGNFGLKPGERLKPAGRFLGAAAGLAAGAAIGAATGLGQGARRAKALNKNNEKKGAGAGIWGATKGTIGGLVGGAARGIYHGSKKGNAFKNISTGIKNQTEANKRFGNKEENGYGLGAQIGDKARSLVGAKSRIEQQEASKAPIKRQDEALKYITDTESSIKKRALEKIGEGSASAQKTKDAAADWAKKQTRVKDLEDPMSEARKEYQVGSVKDDDNSKQAYKDELDKKNEKIGKIDLAKISAGITDDSLGIDKNHFRMTITEQQYDQVAHEKAKSQFMKDTGKLTEDGSPIMELDEKAWEASKDQFTKTKESEIFDEQSYRKALNDARNAKVEEIKNNEIQKIESEFKQNTQAYVYRTNEEAETALAYAKNKAAEDFDNAQKAVVAAYVANEEDGAITQMIAELKAHIDGKEKEPGKYEGGYNSTASADKKLTVDYDEIKQNFKAFSDKVKKDDDTKYPGNYRSTINKNAAEIINIDTEIDKIKRQTDGTQDKK